jgi:hypothetical protein
MWLLAAAFCTAATGVSGDEAFRTFTDNEGRTINARILEATVREVRIERDDGQVFRAPIDRFCAEDIAFISRWRTLHELQRPSALEFSARRFLDNTESQRSRSTRTQTSEAGYEVSIRNNLGYDLEGLRVEYRVFYRQGAPGIAGQDRPLSVVRGTADVNTVGARNGIALRTSSTRLAQRRFDASACSTVSSSRRHARDDLAGVWVRVYKGDELVGDFSQPSALKDRETW